MPEEECLSTICPLKITFDDLNYAACSKGHNYDRWAWSFNFNTY